MVTKNPSKKPMYNCIICNFISGNKKDYRKHLLTLKHINGKHGNTNDNEKKPMEEKIYSCECGKEYKHCSGLSRHKKKCSHEQIIDEKDEDKIENNLNSNLSENVVIEILKQNQEFKELIVEQNKYMLEQNQKIMELSKNTNITNNTNCHNKTKFNLNFFLNEQCKDALNLTDFINDLQVQLTDLENVGRLGYTEGISKIFIDGLKQLDISKRPIHCSDFKREVLYIKDQDAWEKENEENKKIKKAIHHISHKNIKQIQKWTDNHPHCKESDSKQNDQYLRILCESMGSAEPSNLEKVIRNIAKEVMIDK